MSSEDEKLKRRAGKKELVERLECYDRNFNFGLNQCDEEQATRYAMTTPDTSIYKDIHKGSKIPEVTIKSVEAFQKQFLKSSDGKPEALYNGRFLQSIRHSTQGDLVFITGRVSAEMKKTVEYKVDDYGVVQETQCECSVGLGPEAHCKHVLLVLYALTKQKEGVLTKQTCTQVLQTYHRTKGFNASPMQMSDIKLRKSGGLQQLQSFDPRPSTSRNTLEYADHFRNVWINSRAENVPIRQLFAPANIYAVDHDHDYLPKTSGEYFLEHISVTDITDEEKVRVEQSTLGQHTNKTWKEERTKRLHASNYGRICKATARTDFTKMAESLTQITNFTSKPTAHGHKYEPVAVQSHTRKTVNDVQSCVIVVSKETPYLACSPDGLIGEDGILEVKCPYTCKDQQITPSSVSYLVSNSDHIYYYQIQGNLLCTKRKWCDFVVWTRVDVLLIHITRDDVFIEELKAKLHVDEFFHLFKKKCPA